MAKYKVFAGLSGSFGGATYHGIFEGTAEKAEEYAWELACEEFEQYEGSYGLPSYGEIIEEYEADELENAEDAAWERFCEERESWLDYSIKKVED